MRDVKPHSLDGLWPDEFLGLTHTCSVHWSETSGERWSDRCMVMMAVSFPKYWKSIGSPSSIPWCLCFYWWVLWLSFSRVCFERTWLGTTWMKSQPLDVLVMTLTKVTMARKLSIQMSPTSLHIVVCSVLCLVWVPSSRPLALVRW